MVYSCGGFSRCFRIARFYDLEGPPVGVEYARPEDERKALNPELQNMVDCRVFCGCGWVCIKYEVCTIGVNMT